MRLRRSAGVSVAAICAAMVAGCSANLPIGGMKDVITKAQAYCERKRAFYIVDLPEAVDSPAEMIDWMETNEIPRHENSAIYFPRLLMPDPLNENRPANVGPSGTLAGIYARIDASRGVWKAPAGTEATDTRAKFGFNVNFNACRSPPPVTSKRSRSSRKCGAVTASSRVPVTVRLRAGPFNVT